MVPVEIERLLHSEGIVEEVRPLGVALEAEFVHDGVIVDSFPKEHAKRRQHIEPTGSVEATASKASAVWGRI